MATGDVMAARNVMATSDVTRCVDQDTLRRHQVIRRLSWHGSVMSPQRLQRKRTMSLSGPSITRPQSLPCIHNFNSTLPTTAPIIPLQLPVSHPLPPSSPVFTKQMPSSPVFTKQMPKRHMSYQEVPVKRVASEAFTQNAHRPQPITCTVYNPKYLYTDRSNFAPSQWFPQFGHDCGAYFSQNPELEFLKTEQIGIFPLKYTTVYYQANHVIHYIQQGSELDVTSNPVESQQRGYFLTIIVCEYVSLVILQLTFQIIKSQT